jgi:putative oxidoreductase
MNLDAWQPKVLSLFRFVAGLVFLQHGTQKILHFPAPLAPPPGAGAAARAAGGAAKAAAAGAAHAAPSLAGMLAPWSGWFELIGGILMVIGLFSRPVAFLLSGEMAIAFFTAHFPRSPLPILNGGDLAVLFCFIFLYLFFAGPGPISVDGMMKKKI